MKDMLTPLFIETNQVFNTFIRSALNSSNKELYKILDLGSGPLVAALENVIADKSRRYHIVASDIDFQSIQ